MRRAPSCYAVRTPCHAARIPAMRRAPPPCGANHHFMLRTPLSCCAQSQHPERPVERSEPGVPGFRDYARNDEVEDPTLCDEYRDVTLRAHPRHAAQTTTSRGAHPPSRGANHHVMFKRQAAGVSSGRKLSNMAWVATLKTLLFSYIRILAWHHEFPVILLACKLSESKLYV